MSTFTDQPYAPETITESRLSKSSLSSLIVSIISIVCCPIGSVVGFLALLLGIVGLMRTSAVGVHGRGLAITGIVLGLIGMVIGTGLVIGFTQAVGMFVEPAEESIVTLDAGDTQAFRATLSASLDQNITDEQISAFAQSLRDDYGALVTAPSSVWEYIGLAAQGGPDMQSGQSQGWIPVAAEFDGGIVVFLFEPPANPSGMGLQFDDIGYIRQDGAILWLSEVEP